MKKKWQGRKLPHRFVGVSLYSRDKKEEELREQVINELHWQMPLLKKSKITTEVKPVIGRVGLHAYAEYIGPTIYDIKTRRYKK